MSFLGGKTIVSLLIAFITLWQPVKLNKHAKLSMIYKSIVNFLNLSVSTCNYISNVCFV